jgi:asparagine synthase (glutamine-hydrolysing)
MCGLAGIFSFRGDKALAISAMTDGLRHRGPDDGGIWQNSSDPVVLGHRRLSIIDLSQAGHQPMVSHCGRFVLIFNGEIYNHQDLRDELNAGGTPPQWRGHSDTETLVEGIARWGVEETLRRCAGMFALAMWDRKARVLKLARDRMGEKPLYYGWAGQDFVFGSELKSLREHPQFDAEICRTALEQYLRFAYVPAPRSIWQGVFKLEPGCVLTITGAAPPAPPPEPVRPGNVFGNLSIERYWSLAQVTDAGAREPYGSDGEAAADVEACIDRAVQRQMLADVPLGAFLSGGVDSSTIVALMQRHSARPVQTFTISFEEAAFDESGHARLVAQHLGADHTEIPVSAAEARAVIPRMPELFDEPFADASQIPTFLVCRAARSRVKVALTGDGGDELFGGYPRYQNAPRVWSYFNTVPFALRRVIGSAITAVPVDWWDAVAALRSGGANGDGGARAGDRVHRVASRLTQVRSLDDLYINLVSAWPDPARIIAPGYFAGKHDLGLLDDPAPSSADDPAIRMMFRDAISYLPDDILCKVDRASMGTSLETRAPLLDPDVVAAAARLPIGMRIRKGESKWALRRLLYKHVPRELIERPKVGFFLPVGQWLRGPLRDWAETLLAHNRLEAEGVLQPGPIRAMWKEHVSGTRDWTLQLWTILMFQAWLEANDNAVAKRDPGARHANENVLPATTARADSNTILAG